jgi:signal transduction histidine kinase
MPVAPIPDNEMDRLISLSAFDIDHLRQENNFRGLAKIAAKIAGTTLSEVNFIDAYTQWTVSNHGANPGLMPREDSVCQYTIMQEGSFEVKDMRADTRFNDKPYVTGAPHLGYYFGIPLKSPEGSNIGALCVLDQEIKELSPEKVELLRIISDEILNRLRAFKAIEILKTNLMEAKESKYRVAHDIRGPLGGIVGLSKIIIEQGENNTPDEVLEFANLIHESGNSLLELTDEILSSDKEQALTADQFNLMLFKERLSDLYMALAKNKGLSFIINISPVNALIPFSKNKLLQITGNLISNAMKFTPAGGAIQADLELNIEKDTRTLVIRVTDSGVGLTQEGIDHILNGVPVSTDGTSGETGYGFGLVLVKHLTDNLNGKLSIRSVPGEATTFEVAIPQ